MYHRATQLVSERSACLLAIAVLMPLTMAAQTDWRPIGNAALVLDLPSVATGPVQRVWYSADGMKLFALTRSGRAFETSDFEKWTPSDAAPPAVPPAMVRFRPEAVAQIRSRPEHPARVYAVGRDAYRSDDGGNNWTNVTGWRGESILGGPLSDAAISPSDPDEIVVAGSHGIWRSMDGGVSWAGLNATLPNLPLRRIVQAREQGRPVQIELSDGTEWVWQQGEKFGWRPAEGALALRERRLRDQLAFRLSAQLSSAAASGDFQYAGSVDGRLWVSPDRGATWREDSSLAGRGAVVRLWADPRDPQFAVALVSTQDRARVLKTQNAGQFWDDVTANLPAGGFLGVAMDRPSNTIYAAGAAGVWYADLNGLAVQWIQLRSEPAVDVALDSEGNQLFVGSEGSGVIAGLAPHRLKDPRVVSAGDLTVRPAAPGALLSVLGSRVTAARANAIAAPVLAASDAQSQIQIPFEARGSSVALTLEFASGRLDLPLILRDASPAIFIDGSGNPMLLNGDTGMLLEASAPARSGTRVQILATGLGAVRPAWPTGLAAPVTDPPAVAGKVRVLLDRNPLEVTRAVLAPGYVGFYLVEVELPQIVNTGTAELSIEVDGQESNRVRIFLDN